MIDKGYGIMPNTILFNNNLTDKQKLLYCYVSSLCAENGFCWASNKYIADKLGVNQTTISTNINILERFGFIEIQQGANQQRKCLLKNQNPPFEKSEGTPFEKSKDNITKKNITNITLLNSAEHYSFLDSFLSLENPQIKYQIEKQGKDVYFQKQCLEIDKLQKDGYPLEAIQTVLAFIKQDSFWNKNILSVKKLRDKDRNGIPYIVRMIEQIQNWKPVNKIGVLPGFN